MLKRFLIFGAIVVVAANWFFAGPIKRGVIDGLKGAGWIDEEQELLPRMRRVEVMPGGESGGSNEEVLEKKVSNSSVIAFTELKERAGKYEQVIVTLSKLRTNVECFYEKGDSLGSMSLDEGRNSARRHAHFMRGSPAEISGSMSIHNGLLLKQRDLPESFLRKLILSSQQERRPAEPIRLSLPDGGHLVVKGWDELVASSAVVVLGKIEIKNEMRVTIAEEVFYLDSARRFPVSIGKEMDSQKMSSNTAESHPERMLIFIDQELGHKTISYAVSGGRISGFGEMPVVVARKRLLDLVEESRK